MNSRIVAVIDDEPAVRDAMRFLIELEGCVVATYVSAVAFLDDADIVPACMIVDYHMPEMDGLALAEELSKADRIFPILLMSGALSAAVIEKAAELGIAQVLAKPPAADAIMAFVAAHC